MKQNITPQQHSTVVGGSTAKRVLACPGSVKLCQRVPPGPPTDAAREGSMLHAAIAYIIKENLDPMTVLAEGFSFGGVELTQELYDEKLLPAVQQFDALIDELEEEHGDTATILVESEVSFGDYIPEAFGSCDILVRIGGKVVVLDWKFGHFSVSAQENEQLMFYCAAAMRTKPEFFDGVKELELVIIQPTTGAPSRWVTNLPRIAWFERELRLAVAAAHSDTPRYKEGDHCRWCAAQPICPLMTGAMEVCLKADLETIGIEKLGLAFAQTYILESFIAKLRTLVELAVDSGIDVPGCKLVEKRATRKWAKTEDETVEALYNTWVTDEHASTIECDIYDDFYRRELLSVAQMENLFKQMKIAIPEELIVKESTGTTVVPDSDPRPAVLLIGKQLEKALGRLL